jgi:hypothetical protein
MVRRYTSVPAIVLHRKAFRQGAGSAGGAATGVGSDEATKGDGVIALLLEPANRTARVANAVLDWCG